MYHIVRTHSGNLASPLNPILLDCSLSQDRGEREIRAQGLTSRPSFYQAILRLACRDKQRGPPRDFDYSF